MRGLSLSVQRIPRGDTAGIGFPHGSPWWCCGAPRHLTLSALKSNQIAFLGCWLGIQLDSFLSRRALARSSCPACSAEIPSSSHERHPRWTRCQLAVGAACALTDHGDDICSLRASRCSLQRRVRSTAGGYKGAGWRKLLSVYSHVPVELHSKYEWVWFTLLPASEGKGGFCPLLLRPLEISLRL